jgi:2-methylcitrate dehydratase PrpD
MAMGSITEKLAEAVVEMSYESLPTEVVSEAKRCLIDWVGVTLWAADSPTARVISALVEELGGREQASIIPSGMKTTVLNASLVNGSVSHVLDFDDVHSEAIIHTSAVLAPAALAGGEWKKRGGKEVLSAFVAGFETATRVSFAAGKGPHQLDRGWHPTSTLGRIGAAVCFGKLLNLDPRQMAMALGIAATQAGGLRRVFGTMAKHFHAGKAAYDGILAALLAAKGLTAPVDILEGEDGLCQVLSGKFEEIQILDGWGERFEILRNSLKPYPACYQTHAVINACMDIYNEHRLTASEVEEVVCEVNPIAPEVAGLEDPKTGSEAKFSLSYCAARGLMGDVSLGKFVPEEIGKEDVQRLMKRVQIKTNPSFNVENATVELKTRDGRKIGSRIYELKGGPSRPMADEELDTKFVDLASPVFKNDDKVRNALRTLRTLEGLEDVSQLLTCLTQSRKV